MSQRSFTDEQITKLQNDARAFLLAASFLATQLDQFDEGASHPKIFSLQTALYTNIGIAFELNLKALYAKEGSDIRKEHRLARLFDHLPQEIQAGLKEIFSSCGCPEITAYRRSSQKPPDIRADKLEDFRWFLAYLDKTELYGRKYSYEKFSSSEKYWYAPDFNYLLTLIAKITLFVTDAESKLPLASKDNQSS